MLSIYSETMRELMPASTIRKELFDARESETLVFPKQNSCQIFPTFPTCPTVPTFPIFIIFLIRQLTVNSQQSTVDSPHKRRHYNRP
jgi:hypothetical protein